MTEGSFGKDLRGGLVWSTLALIGSKAFTFVATVILARLLVPADFGVLAALVVFLGLLDLAADLGMGATVVYEQEEGITDRVHTAFTVNVIVIILLTGVAVALAPLVADFFRVPQYTHLFRLGSLTLLLTGLGNVADNLLLRDMDFRRRTLSQVARPAVRGIVAIVLALTGFGVASLVVGMLAGAAAGTVVQWVLTDFRPRLRLNWEEARSMLGYGGGAVGLEVVAIIATRMDQIVIGRVVNEAALGLYSVAFRIPELLIDTLTWNVSLVAFPAMSRERVRGREGVGSATLKLVRYQGLFALPTAAALAVTAPQLVIVVFGDQWAAAGPVMSAVAFVSAITAVIFPLGDVFKALGRQRILMTLGLIEIPISLAAMIIAAPKGIELVAWVRVATIAVHSVAVVYFVARLARFGPADFLRALRPGVVTGLATAAGAAVVRVLLPSPELIPVLLELVAAGVCGVVALRFVAPDVIAQALALAPALSRRSAPGGAAS